MKKITVLSLCSTMVLPVMAGGLVTNTNQNVAFLRQLSQEAIIDITGLYMNPAGTAFLAPGNHFSFNIQNAKQNRDIATTFPLFVLNGNEPQAQHKFGGEASAPVIPSIQWSYNWEKWSINANFAVNGGGGKCEFGKGLGSFEALYAGQLFQLVPAAVNAQLSQVLPLQLAAGLQGAGVPEPYASQLAATETHAAQLAGYTLDAYMQGTQYQFGLSLGATYKVLDNLAVFAGIRGIYATNNYNGYVKDVMAKYAYTYEVPADDNFNFHGLAGQGSGEQDLSSNELRMDADQVGFGITPMLGIDWKINEQWNVAAKYEFKTRLRMENSTEMNAFAAGKAADNKTLGQFIDGGIVAADIPSMLAVGVQYSPIQAVRLQAGYHFYGDKSATQYDDKQKLIDDNTWEITAGAEWDCCQWVTLSAGWQKTQYGLGDQYLSDLSFTTSSQSWGAGARIHFTEKLNLDLGFMQTLYDEREVKTASPAGDKIDLYSRTNRVFGIGLNVSF